MLVEGRVGQTKASPQGPNCLADKKAESRRPGFLKTAHAMKSNMAVGQT